MILQYRSKVTKAPDPELTAKQVDRLKSSHLTLRSVSYLLNINNQGHHSAELNRLIGQLEKLTDSLEGRGDYYPKR